MDIRVINSRRQIVNVSDGMLEVQDRYIVKVSNEGKSMLVEVCRDEEEAKRVMERIIESVIGGHIGKQRDIVINMPGIREEIER